MRYLMLVFGGAVQGGLILLKATSVKVHGTTPGQPGLLQQFTFRNQSQWSRQLQLLHIITVQNKMMLFRGMEIELSLCMWSCVVNAYQPPLPVGCTQIQQWDSYGFVWKELSKEPSKPTGWSSLSHESWNIMKWPSIVVPRHVQTHPATKLAG